MRRVGKENYLNQVVGEVGLGQNRPELFRSENHPRGDYFMSTASAVKVSACDCVLHPHLDCNR
jgi:hypothetical protein